MISQVKVQDVDRTTKKEEENKIYGGSTPPSYLTSAEFDKQEELHLSDNFSVSSPNARTVNPSDDNSLDPPSEDDDELNYIPNDENSPQGTKNKEDAGKIKITGPQGTEKKNNTKKTGGTDTTTQTGGTTSSDTNALSLSQSVDQELEDSWNNFDEEDLYGSQDGYYYINEEDLEKLYNALLSWCNLRLLIAMVFDQKRETKDLFFDVIVEADLSDIGGKKTSLTESVAKANEKLMKGFQRGLAILIQFVQTKNEEQYRKDMNEAKEKEGSAWDKFISSGKTDEEATSSRQEANERYQAAMDKSLSALKNILGQSFHGLNSLVDDRGNNALNDLANSDDYIVYDENGYIDLNQSKQWLADLRHLFVSLLNVNKIIVSEEAQKDSMRKMFFELMTGSSALSSRFGAVEQAVEADAAHQTMIFDRALNQILMTQSLSNKIKFYKLQLEKMKKAKVWTVLKNIATSVQFVANIVAAVAAVVAIVAAIIGGPVGLAVAAVALIVAGIAYMVGVIAGMAASVFGFIGMMVSNTVQDSYNPELQTESTPDAPNKSGNDAMDQAAELDYQEEKILSEVGTEQLDELDDGYLAIDSEELAALNKQLTAIQNMQRLLVKAVRQAAQKRKMMFRLLTGLSSAPVSGGFLQSAVENILSQRSLEFEVLVSNLTDYKNAQNDILQKERFIEQQIILFFANMAGGIADLCGLKGSSILAKALSQYFVASEYDTRNIDYEPDPDGLNSSVNPDDESVGASLDEGINDAYEDLFNNGTMGVGDGYIGLDTDGIKGLQKKLERLFVSLSTIFSFIDAKAKILRVMWQAMGVMTDEAPSSRDLIRGLFEGVMRSFRLGVEMLKEKVEVANRANQAQQEYDKATRDLIVSVPLAIVGMVLALIPATAPIGILILAAVALYQAISDLAYAIQRARDDYGQIATQEERDVSLKNDEPDEKGDTAIEVAQEADEIEASAQESAASNAAIDQDLGYGNWGVNGGVFAVANYQLEVANRIRDLLADIAAQKKEILSMIARAAGFSRPDSSGFLELGAYIKNVVSNETLKTQIQGIEQYVSRHNQINEAKFERLLAIINLCFTVISTGLTVYNETEYGMKIASKEVQAAAAKKNNNEKADLSEDEKEQLASDKKSYKNLEMINLGVSSLQSVLDILLYYLKYSDIRAREKEASNEISTEAKNTEIIQGQQESGQMGYAKRIDAMEANTLQIAIDSSKLDTLIQISDMLQRIEEQLLEAEKGIAEAMGRIGNTIKERLKHKKEEATAKAREKNNQDHQTNRSNFLNDFIALSSEPSKFSKAIAKIEAFFKRTPSEQSNQAVLEQVDALSNILKAMIGAYAKVASNAQALEESSAQIKNDSKVSNPEFNLAVDLPTELAPAVLNNVPAAQMQEALMQLVLQEVMPAPVESQINGTPVDLQIEFDGGQIKVTVTNKDGSVYVQNGVELKSIPLKEFVDLKTSINANYQLSVEDKNLYDAIASFVNTQAEKVKRTEANFRTMVLHSQAFADASEVQELVPGQTISLFTEAKKEVAAYLGKRKISAMKASDIQAYYTEFYNAKLAPECKKLESILARKSKILEKLIEAKNKGDQQEYIKCLTQLNLTLAEEGAVRVKIAAFSQHVSNLNTQYHSETGQNLTPALSDNTRTSSVYTLESFEQVFSDTFSSLLLPDDAKRVSAAVNTAVNKVTQELVQAQQTAVTPQTTGQPQNASPVVVSSSEFVDRVASALSLDKTIKPQEQAIARMILETQIQPALNEVIVINVSNSLDKTNKKICILASVTDGDIRETEVYKQAQTEITDKLLQRFQSAQATSVSLQEQTTYLRAEVSEPAKIQAKKSLEERAKICEEIATLDLNTAEGAKRYAELTVSLRGAISKERIAHARIEAVEEYVLMRGNTESKAPLNTSVLVASVKAALPQEIAEQVVTAVSTAVNKVAQELVQTQQTANMPQTTGQPQNASPVVVSSSEFVDRVASALSLDKTIKPQEQAIVLMILEAQIKPTSNEVIVINVANPADNTNRDIHVLSDAVNGDIKETEVYQQAQTEVASKLSQRFNQSAQAAPIPLNEKVEYLRAEVSVPAKIEVKEALQERAKICEEIAKLDLNTPEGIKRYSELTVSLEGARNKEKMAYAKIEAVEEYAVTAENTSLNKNDLAQEVQIALEQEFPQEKTSQILTMLDTAVNKVCQSLAQEQQIPVAAQEAEQPQNANVVVVNVSDFVDRVDKELALTDGLSVEEKKKVIVILQNALKNRTETNIVNLNIMDINGRPINIQIVNDKPNEEASSKISSVKPVSIIADKINLENIGDMKIQPERIQDLRQAVSNAFSLLTERFGPNVTELDISESLEEVLSQQAVLSYEERRKIIPYILSQILPKDSKTTMVAETPASSSGTFNAQVVSEAVMPTESQIDSQTSIIMPEEIKGANVGKLPSDPEKLREILQNSYDKLRQTIFMPAQKKLQDALARRVDILDKMKLLAESDPKYKELKRELEMVKGQEAEARASIKAFHKCEAQLYSVFRSKTGKELKLETNYQEPAVVLESKDPTKQDGANIDKVVLSSETSKQHTEEIALNGPTQRIASKTASGASALAKEAKKDEDDSGEEDNIEEQLKIAYRVSEKASLALDQLRGSMDALNDQVRLIKDLTPYEEALV